MALTGNSKKKTFMQKSTLTGMDKTEEITETQPEEVETESQIKQEQIEFASIEKEVKRKVKEEKNSSAGEPEQQNFNLNMNITFGRQPERERKSVQKSFFIKPSTNDKFMALAKATNMSQNDLMNRILEQALENVNI